MKDFLTFAHFETPLWDRVIVFLGATMAGGLTLAELNQLVGAIVGCLTAILLMFRIALAGRQFFEKKQDKESEKAPKKELKRKEDDDEDD